MKTQLNGFAGAISSSFWLAMDDNSNVLVVIKRGSGIDKSVYIETTFYNEEGEVFRKEKERFSSKSFDHFLEQAVIFSPSSFGISGDSETFIELLIKLREVGSTSLRIRFGETSFSLRYTGEVKLEADEVLSLYDFFLVINNRESLE